MVGSPLGAVLTDDRKLISSRADIRAGGLGLMGNVPYLQCNCLFHPDKYASYIHSKSQVGIN